MRREALFPVLLMALAATGGCHKQEPPAPQATQTAAAPATPPATPLAVSMEHKGKVAPDDVFHDLADGSDKKIADFKGRPVLVNLWATWCVPCVKELPALDKLAASNDRLQVVAISEDMEGTKVVLPFLKSKNVGLHPYHDADNALMLALKESGLPVSILYDAEGKEVWRLNGDLDWTGAKAKELLAQAGV